MKQIWVKADPWKKSAITAALECGADAVLVPKGHAAKVKALGRITTVAPDGDIVLGKDVVRVEIRGKADERRAVEAAKSKRVIIAAKDWTIIPLENLIAETEGIFAEVKSEREARTALGILERGVDGLLVDGPRQTIAAIVDFVKATAEQLVLRQATVSKVVPLGMGDRVCIDTCTMMGTGQGMLVGNTSAAMFLVHSESVENPYVEQRPFRVNAGPVHAYVRVPGGRTRYLSELASGDEILVVDAKGTGRRAIIGRTKIERRPLLQVEAAIAKETISLILQNAETIRLTGADGKPISVAALKPGDKVLVYTEAAGRHFGIPVKETIREK